jgi:hypothetical protein
MEWRHSNNSISPQRRAVAGTSLPRNEANRADSLAFSCSAASFERDDKTAPLAFFIGGLLGSLATAS